jgi:phage-related protein
MVAGTIERIQVILQSLTSGFARGLDRAAGTLKSVGKNMQGFGQVMQMPMENFRKINGRMAVMKTVGGRVAKSFRMMTHGMRGFRMEALGVMFFGMMMQKMFLGLLQPVLEAYGVFDLFRVTLLTLFLPVMEMIFPILLKIMEWFMDLPEPVQKAIGIFVLLGVIFGTILMVFGQFALGIGSLIQFLPAIGGAIKAVGVVIAGLSATALAVIAVIIVVIIGMFVAWKENFMGMKQVVQNFIDAVKGAFKAFVEILKNIFGFWIAVFKGDWDGAWEHLKKGFVAMKDFVVNIIKMLVNLIAGIVIGIVRVFKWVVDTVVSFFKWLYDKIVGHSIIPDLISGIIDWFNKLPNAVKNAMRIVGNAFIGVANGIIGAWNTVMSGVSNVIVTILRGVDKLIGVLNKIPGVNIGRYSWNISWGNIPTIPYLANGGIVTKPTVAMIGEKGAEAVVPLNKSNGFGGGDINQTNNYYGFTANDLKRELDDRDRRLVDSIKRLIKQ